MIFLENRESFDLWQNLIVVRFYHFLKMTITRINSLTYPPGVSESRQAGYSKGGIASNGLWTGNDQINGRSIFNEITNNVNQIRNNDTVIAQNYVEKYPLLHSEFIP